MEEKPWEPKSGKLKRCENTSNTTNATECGIQGCRSRSPAFTEVQISGIPTQLSNRAYWGHSTG